MLSYSTSPAEPAAAQAGVYETRNALGEMCSEDRVLTYSAQHQGIRMFGIRSSSWPTGRDGGGPSLSPSCVLLRDTKLI